MLNGYLDEKLVIRNSIDSLNVLLKAVNVKRYHTVSTIGDQNLGHHSHRMCLILRFLLGGGVPSYLYEAALFHDLAESITGDVPATTKWYNPELTEQLDRIEIEWEKEQGISMDLSTKDRLLLTVADKLELVSYCTEQLMLGNQNVRLIRAKGADYCESIAHTLKEHYCFDITEHVHEFIERCRDEYK